MRAWNIKNNQKFLKNSRKNKENWLTKNKNIKNKPKNVVDSFSCILDFPKFSAGGLPDPSYKGNTSVKPSKSFFTTTTAKGKKKKKKKSRKALPN